MSYVNRIHLRPIGGMATVTSNVFHAQHREFVAGSEFYDQLDMGGKQRYRQKLQHLGMCCDPHATMSEEWECNGPMLSFLTYRVFANEGKGFKRE